MDINNITLMTAILTGISVSLIAFILYLKLNTQKKYDEQNKQVVLDDIRKSLEQKIYTLNDRLVQTEERWRDVNHLLLRQQHLNSNEIRNVSFKTHHSNFLKANGISENELNINDHLVFVLTPFNDRYRDEFMVIKETCERIGFKCIRGDEKEFRGDIFPEMLRYIARARIIIANINGRNPNVLYELGVAQAMDKSVILVSKEPKNLPIDIQSQRFVIYNDSNSLKELLNAELKKMM